MSKVSKIENAIIQLGDGDFHKLCNTFLSKKGQYGVIHGLGLKSGTSKSTKGNPDTYFRTENGRYVFVVYTTQQAKIYDKIKKDILKCFDPNKTGVQESDIEEIICCHTSSNLAPGDDKALHELCNAHGVKLTIYGVDEIAQQLYSHYPALACDFLGISIDTNQIVSIVDFVRLYDASKTAAPLDTIFQNRNELVSIEKGIRENEVVIVYGQAGVGKTRIVLEALRHVSSEDGYRLLCVKNNNLPLVEDLLEHTERPGSYLFFIDDANELAGINYILDYVNSSQPDYKFRIVMTVRDYARKELCNVVIKRVKPLLIEIPVVSDDEIKSFLSVNLKIKNEHFLDTIINISGGNLRIAYMAGQIALDSNSLAAVHDVTQVYEQYYSSVVEPIMENDRSLCLTTGVLSLVRVVMLNRTEFLSELLEYAHLNSEDFFENIHRLYQMEVVDVYDGKMAVFADQCLSNYMLYYVFFLKKMIPFSSVLKIGFIHFRKGVIQSVNTLLNIFSKKELCDYIKEEVRKTWDWFSENDAVSYEDFARVFHLFFPDDAFLVAKDMIDKMPQKERKECLIDFNCNPIHGDDRVLGFLTSFNFTSYLDTVIELFLEYIEKSEDNAVKGYNWLKECYGISLKSLNADFYDVIQVSKFLLDKLFVSDIIRQVAFEYAKYALAFEYSFAEIMHGKTINMFNFQLPNDSNGIRTYRGNCWQIVKGIAQIQGMDKLVFSFLNEYAKSVHRSDNISVLLYDKPYVEEIIALFGEDHVRSAVMLREFHSSYIKKGVDFEIPSIIRELPEWKLLDITDDRWLDSGLSYDEFQSNKEKLIDQYAESISIEDTKFVLDTCKSMVELLADDIHFGVKEGINQIVCRLCNDSEKTKIVFTSLLSGDVLTIDIECILSTVFEIMPACEIWSNISASTSARKNQWQFVFFQLLPEEFANDKFYQHLIEYLEDDSDKDIRQFSYRCLRFIDKFLAVDKNVYITLSSIILNKRNYNDCIARAYFALLFNERYYLPTELIELYSGKISLLKEIYFYIINIESFADVKGSFLIGFIEEDDSWIDGYAETICDLIKQNKSLHYRNSQLIWKTDRYLYYFDTIFAHICEECDSCLFEWSIIDAFRALFTYDKQYEEIKENQEKWVIHSVEFYCDSPNLEILFKGLIGLSVELRKRAFHEFLKRNDKYESFERLPLDSMSWGGRVGDIIPDLENRIRFLESLLDETKGVKFLKHNKRIRDRINMWKSEIKNEELEEIYWKLC